MNEHKDLHFKTNVQLKSIIGKDLINDDNIAILELVKNSFDADAKIVQVKYFNLKQNDDEKVEDYSSSTSRLIIQDDGIGMDIDDIRDKWLNIAYSEKKSNKTQHKRRMAGAKGVGRFSCDRLGEYLNLYAKKSKDSNYYKLSIDWKKFEVEDEKKEIQSIPLKYETLTPIEFQTLGFSNFEHGVLLEIIKLRSKWANPIFDKNDKLKEWDTSKFIELKKYLEKLINPNQAFETNDFGIYINANEFISENNSKSEHEKFIGKVENKIFDKLEFKSTSIDSTTLENGKVILTELKDKGETVYWIKEYNPYYPFIKEVKLSIYFLNSYAKAFFTKQTGIQSVNYGSIFLFINGFRIPPYGDVGNDWLALDQRKAQGTRRYLGSRDIIGHIEITDENNDFQIISSREGIVNNEYLKKLTSSERNDSYFYKALRRLERYVVEGLNWDSSIYDSQDKEESTKLKEIESKIISGLISEDELKYREDDKTKRSRVYSTIHSLIAAKAPDVLELYINEDLIIQKIEEEREVSEREFNQLISDFESKKIDSETLSKILLAKAKQNEELKKQINDFSKFNYNDLTNKALLELQEYKKSLENQEITINNLKIQVDTLEKEKQEVEQIVEDQKKQIDRLRLAETITYKDLRDSNHIIGVYADDISKKIQLIKRKIDRKGFLDKFELLEFLQEIGLVNEKINTLTKFTTKSGFLEARLSTKENIVNYIENYVKKVYGSLHKEMNYEFRNTYLIYEKEFQPIELSVVLDNILNNSKKKGAKKVIFNFEKENETLILSIKDIGKPLDNSISKELIFEEGVTSTKGAGLGLSHVKRILEKDFNASIEYNPNYIDGFELIITFKK